MFREGLKMSPMLKMLQSGAQIHRELQTGRPKQNARLYFQNSFHRKECKTERGKRAWTRHLYVKLQIKRISKASILFFFFCNETILKNVEKYHHIVKTMELEESRVSNPFVNTYRTYCSFDCVLQTLSVRSIRRYLAPQIDGATSFLCLHSIFIQQLLQFNVPKLLRLTGSGVRHSSPSFLL